MQFPGRLHNPPAYNKRFCASRGWQPNLCIGILLNICILAVRYAEITAKRADEPPIPCQRKASNRYRLAAFRCTHGLLSFCTFLYWHKRPLLLNFLFAVQLNNKFEVPCQLAWWPFSLLQVIIACQDWPGTFFSPTLAQIAPWLSVLWGFKSDTSKRLKVEFGQGSLLSTTWWSFSKWQAMLLLTGLCCMFYYYLQDYQLKSSSF